MGLDQYIHRIKKESSEEYYWRKFGELQNLMHSIYKRETGKDDDFNCKDLVLTIEICDEVINTIKNRNLPDHSGFFFGGSNLDNEEYLKDAIAKFEYIKEELQHTDSNTKFVYSAWY